MKKIKLILNIQLFAENGNGDAGEGGTNEVQSAESKAQSEVESVECKVQSEMKEERTGGSCPSRCCFLNNVTAMRSLSLFFAKQKGGGTVPLWVN